MSIARSILAAFALFVSTLPAHAGDAPTHLIIHFDVKAERMADFMPIMRDINQLMAGEKGFISAQVFQDNANPHRITLIEAWESEALHRAHFDHINESGDWANVLEMMNSAPDMAYTRRF